MTERVKKAYYLKMSEFKIILAIMGADELFGFQLEEKEIPEQIMLNKMLFEMAKKELIFANEEGLCVNQDIKLIISEIMNAEKMMVISNKTGDYPEKCIYITKEAVSIQICGHKNDFVRLERVTVYDLPQMIMESGFRVEQVLNDYILYQEKKIESYEISEIVRKLFEKSKNDVLTHEVINGCLIVYSAITQKKVLQVLLVNKGIEDYIVVSDINEDVIYHYSEKMIINIIRKCIGEEK